MIAAVLPDNESERLTALRAYELLDTPPERELDELTRLASAICGAPIALISLVDSDRQWFKSRVGLEATETPREIAFCAHAIHQDGLFEVPNALEDQRFHDNPLVTNGPGVRFYAGQSLRTADGYPIGTLCVLDVKPRQLTPEQQEAMNILSRQVMAHFELRRVVAELARAHQQLLELSALKDNFMRIASHDLKNPLTVLKGATAIMQQMLQPGTTVSPQHGELAGILSRTTQNMQRIIEDFLDFRAVADGKLRLVPQDMALNAVCAEVLEAQREYARTKGIELDFQPDPGLPLMMADPERLRQVMANLIGNAIKFSPPGTAVIVRTRAEGKEAVFEVQDHGPGLRPEDYARLFQRYARLSAKPTGGESSTGIGLFICKEMIELHGGQIGAENHADGGAVFWFRLPLQVPAVLTHE